MCNETDLALRALEEAVARVGRVVRARPRVRDALVAATQPALAGLAIRVAGACGFRVFLVESGAEAAATAGGRAFDLILLQADADTAFSARRIRALPAPLGAGPIIAIGANADVAWREDAAEAGIDGFAPANAARLMEVMVLLIGPLAPEVRGGLIGPAELDPVEDDDGDYESANGDDGHADIPQVSRSDGRL